jgi:hypothetical protein
MFISHSMEDIAMFMGTSWFNSNFELGFLIRNFFSIAFFALDTWGAREGYVYVNGAGTGTDYDGSVIRVSSALNGVVSDGYLSGALVWIDADDDGARDWTDSNRNGLWESGEGESWTLTDGQGRYSGLEGSGTLRVAANPNGTTIDISTSRSNKTGFALRGFVALSNKQYFYIVNGVDLVDIEPDVARHVQCAGPRQATNTDDCTVESRQHCAHPPQRPSQGASGPRS